MTAKERQQARLERKALIAHQQVEHYENTISEHELNLARLEALPAALREEAHDELVTGQKRAIAALQLAIKATLAEARKAAAARTPTARTRRKRAAGKRK